MRISDWSSDVCSSDLPFAVCPEIGAGQVESKRFGGFAGLLPLRQHAMPSRLWCPDCAFWVGEIGPYSGAADDDPYVSIYYTEQQLLLLGLPSRSRSAERRGGTECVSTCRSRWSQLHEKQKENKRTKQKP